MCYTIGKQDSVVTHPITSDDKVPTCSLGQKNHSHLELSVHNVRTQA